MEQRHIRLCLEKNANCRGKPQNNNTSVINKSNAINVSENCQKTVGGNNKRARQIVVAAVNSPRLRYLVLGNNHISPDVMRPLMETRGREGLCVRLSRCNIPAEGVIALPLAAAIETLTALTYLIISDNDVSAAAAERFARSLKSLKILGLGNNHISPDVMRPLMETRGKEGLCVRELSENRRWKQQEVRCVISDRCNGGERIRLSSQGRVYNGAAFRTCPDKIARYNRRRTVVEGEIRSARISDNDVSAAAAERFARSLKSLKSLKILGLSRCNIPAEGMMALAAGIETLKTLTRLKVKAGHDKGSGLSRSDFRYGYTFFGFDLTPDECDGACFHLVQKGIEMHFRDALPTTVNVIAYAEFESELEIDKSCNIIYDY
ncbi:hypothetical protein LSAT2_027484 [Lamellibrachia satsuma]|nr:hypothetical protein LSAT2_027484 [Lamellibrachia satsuma]